MNLRRFLSLLMAFWAFASSAADTPVVTATVPVSKGGTNDIALPIQGKNYTNSVEMQLIAVPGGFWAGKYEVTQKEYLRVVGSNPSAFVGNRRPVDSVSWNDAMTFCQRLTEMERKLKGFPEKYHYTLPTEDEWQALVADASLDSAISSLNGNGRTESSNVGTLVPNSLGLYDVRGNVMEFCLGDTSKPYRFLKGGSWQDHVEVNLRPEFRWNCLPDDKMNTFGFRCLLKPN